MECKVAGKEVIDVQGRHNICGVNQNYRNVWIFLYKVLRGGMPPWF